MSMEDLKQHMADAQPAQILLYNEVTLRHLGSPLGFGVVQPCMTALRLCVQHPGTTIVFFLAQEGVVK